MIGIFLIYRLSLPCADYATDTKSVLDQAIRILQAMIDVAADCGWLATTIRIQQLLQMVVQAIWIDDPSIMILPHMDSSLLPFLQDNLSPEAIHLPVLQQYFSDNSAQSVLRKQMDVDQIHEIQQVLSNLPIIDVSLSIQWGEQTVSASTVRPEWIPVPTGEECLLNVAFSRSNSSLNSSASTNLGGGGARPKQSKLSAPPPQSRNSNRSAYAPRFPKPKDEGWFMTLGSVDDNELVAIKRVTLSSIKSSQQLAFVTPEKEGRFILTFYLMSDSYVGLDQQYSILLDVGCQKVEPPLVAKDYYLS